MDIPEGQISVVVLGTAQDAGVPHAGCICSRCQAAHEDYNQVRFAASIAIVDTRQQPARVWLVDVTPDVSQQLFLLRDILGPHPSRGDRVRQPEGLFLTHGHMGHTAGLAHLGPEGMAVESLPVYASQRLVGILKDTLLWFPLLDRLELISLTPYSPLEIAPGLSITPVPVPHRDEVGGGTLAFKIAGQASSLLYVPDIDSWALWSRAREMVAACDVALVDATFYRKDELGAGKFVSHPLVTETLAYFDDLPVRLVLTHLNHTNPLLDVGSDERQHVESRGASVAHRGQCFTL